MGKRNTSAAILGLLAAFLTFSVALAQGNSCENRNNNTFKKLLECVTSEGVRDHQAALQAIADANGGTRVSGSSGYDASVDYVVDTMTAAGYEVTVDEFEFEFFQETAAPLLEQTAPGSIVYVQGTDYFTMDFSGSGDETADLQAVDLVLPPAPAPNTSTSGCEPADFAGFIAGNIALIQRGTCSFFDKAANAEAVGAVGVIIFNEGQPGRDGLLFGTLGGVGVNIPVVGTTFALGDDLAATPGAIVHIQTTTVSETRSTANVFAESTQGRDDNVVMAGAHLDSVAAGPGINDNGSGSSALLEIAEQMAKVKPRNTVRFAWWGAEESGLIGSIDWVVRAFDSGELNDVALYLNFDMIGSPNFVRFVYADDGVPGSDVINDLFHEYFDELGLPVEETAIQGRSDHFAFQVFGVPTGGLFTGAEAIKTPAQVAIYGGTAGDQLDPCYHLACDTFDNVSLDVLEEMSDGAALAVLQYAMNTEEINGVSGKGNFAPDRGASSDHRNDRLIR